MIGDKYVIRVEHTRAAEGVYNKVREKLIGSQQAVALTVAGESGAGKSEIALEIARFFSERDGINNIILHQDDYFIRPPKTNAQARKKDISLVGTQEVNLELLNEHLKLIRQNGIETGGQIIKPLVDFDNDQILEETIDSKGIKLIIAEGTYCTLLDADLHVFIDISYLDTYKHRKERGREKQDEYTNKILEIEHRIISSHKQKAEIIINKHYDVE